MRARPVVSVSVKLVISAGSAEGSACAVSAGVGVGSAVGSGVSVGAGVDSGVSAGSSSAVSPQGQPCHFLFKRQEEPVEQRQRNIESYLILMLIKLDEVDILQ